MNPTRIKFLNIYSKHPHPMALIRTIAVVFALLVSFAAVLYKPITLRLEVLGLNRPLSTIQNVHGEDFRLIPDTLYCEDLHYHESSELLFGTSEEKAESRWKWFPPFVWALFLFGFCFVQLLFFVAVRNWREGLKELMLRARIERFDESYASDRGTIIVVNPEVSKPQHLFYIHVTSAHTSLHNLTRNRPKP